MKYEQPRLTILAKRRRSRSGHDVEAGWQSRLCGAAPAPPAAYEADE